MQIDYDIVFEGKTPDIEAILNIVKQNTGLYGIEYDSYCVSHPAFNEYWFGMSKEEDGVIHIWSIFGRMWYLLEATIAALVSLGGKSEWLPRDIAENKWVDVQKNYKEVKVI